MRTLERVSIIGYKSIRELRNLEIRQLNVLVGANGAGKTNFISLFKLLNRLISRKLQLFVGQSGGADPFLYFGRKVTSEIEIDLEFGENTLGNGYEVKLTPSVRGNLVFAKESWWFHDRRGHPQPFRYSSHYQRIVETIRLVAPFFDDFVLRPTPENQNKIRLEWREKQTDDYFDASYFSDGALRFICLATLLLQ